MLKSVSKLLFVFFTLTIYILPQSKSEWFPDNLNIQPFTANVIEPKTGFEFLIAKSEIRLNVGTSRDFYKVKDENSSLSFGADFFTYSLLRSTGEFHFPVDAIDYLFGLNAGYKIHNSDFEYGFRVRLSHISAHFVDGNFDYTTKFWRNGRAPQVYSREFIGLFPFFKYENLRLYTGFTFIFNVTPDFLGKEIYQFGFDYYLPEAGFGIFSPFAAYDFKLSKISKFAGNNSIVIGMKFGKSDSKGFSIRFCYLSGKSIHGEYYDVNENYSSIGFNIDL